MAFTGIVSVIASHGADLLVEWDLAEQFRQHRRIADMAAGCLDGAHLQRFLVDPNVELTPDTPFGATMPARIPLAFTLRLDAGAIDEQVQRGPLAPR